MSGNFTTVTDGLPTRSTPGEWLTIGQVSRRTGLDTKTIRYYESIGLLPSPPRQANNYRRYGLADVNRLLLLRRIRLLGAPLSQAKQLLAGATDARCADVQDALIALVTDRLRALDQEIAELHALRAEIEGYRDSLAICHPDTGMVFSECDDMGCIAGTMSAHDDAACDCHQEEEDHACSM